MPRLKFITMCGIIRSLKSTYAGSFIIDFHRKFLFLDFAAREKNIFLGLVSCTQFLNYIVQFVALTITKTILACQILVLYHFNYTKLVQSLDKPFGPLF